MTVTQTKAPALYTVEDGRVRLFPHHGQVRALDTDKRFVVVLAGTQGGKTSFGPWWLFREIQQKGPGDYIIVTPTFPLLNLKALPEFLRVFETLFGLGSYNKSDKVFRFDALGEIRTWGKEQETETRVIFGHAQDPESLESATAKAAWLDEAGQNKFKLASFDAVMRRLSLSQGRVLITTTPYNLGWIKQTFWDRQHERDDVELIRFDSTENPAFPQDEMDRARRDMPRWKFDMFYRAMFTRPAGMIYDCFDEAIHKVKAFPVPDDWRRYMGQDYGGVNTAAVYIAQEPGENGRYFAYREYWHGGRTANEHKEAMLVGEPGVPMAYGGAASEDHWRLEFSAAGLYVGKPPVSAVELGINRVYGAIKRDEFFVMDTCPMLLDELLSYSRKLDDMGEPTADIADKSTYHVLDSLRYIGSALWPIDGGPLIIW
jgi:hypothetical protein